MKRAGLFCERLTNQVVGLGEARYHIFGSSFTSNTAYANAYYDGGSELSLASGYPVGWLPTADDPFQVGFTTEIEDLSPYNCGRVTVEMTVYRALDGCTQSNVMVSYASQKANTCALPASSSPGNIDYYLNNRFEQGATIHGPGAYYYVVRVIDFEATPPLRAIDTGCFHVSNSENACF